MPEKPPKEKNKMISPKVHDEELWDQFIEDITPLEQTKTGSVPKKSKIQRILRPSTPHNFIKPPFLREESQKNETKSREIDHKLKKRFERGEIRFDATLDLHGLTLDKAHHRLYVFLLGNIQAGARCVLIVTGKGLNSPEGETGVIRRHFKSWLDHPDLAPHILSVTTAQPRHGGAGAFYILLRRTRPATL